MVLLSRRSRPEESKAEIEVGSRVVVLGGRNFPSFQANDQGRVLRVDKEALNCEVLFDGQQQPVPVALRHLSVATERRKSSLSDGQRSRSASPRRSVLFEPVAEVEQRLRNCEVAVEGAQITLRKGRQKEEDLGSQGSVEERLARVEQRISQEVEVLAKQLREAVSFGQAQESRANALERHLKSSGLQLPGSGTLPAASFNSGPLYLSAALPPRLVASPGRMETEACPQCGTLNKPGSKFCIKCGVTLERPVSASSLSASTASQTASYVRGSSYLAAAPQPGSGAAHLIHMNPMMMHPPAAMAPGFADDCGLSPASHLSQPGLTTPPQMLTPRLVIPQRPFG